MELTLHEDLETLSRMRRVTVGVLNTQQYKDTLAMCDTRMKQLVEAHKRIAQLETELAATKLELALSNNYTPKPPIYPTVLKRIENTEILSTNEQF